jgi:hypothetical protein
MLKVFYIYIYIIYIYYQSEHTLLRYVQKVHGEGTKELFGENRPFPEERPRAGNRERHRFKAIGGLHWN